MSPDGQIGIFKTQREAEEEGFNTPLSKEEASMLSAEPKELRHERLRKLRAAEELALQKRENNKLLSKKRRKMAKKSRRKNRGE